MATRTVSNAVYRRNRAFWQRRQRRGDEIRVTRLQRIIAIFYGLPIRGRSPLISLTHSPSQ